jgi:hypothetical protein
MHGIWFKSQRMKKEIYIQIPEPCHEDWNKMTPVQQGRYCQSCSKEVVDFSLMTDQAIMHFLSKPRGKTCGNFSSDQLNRVIKEPATPAKKRVWAVMLSFLLPLFVSNKGKAQMGLPKITITPEKEVPKAEVTLRGDTITVQKKVLITIHGQVIDTSKNAVPFASIKIKSSSNNVSADKNGFFQIQSESSIGITLTISSIGFTDQEVSIHEKSDKVRKLIVLQPKENWLEDVVVVNVPITTPAKMLPNYPDVISKSAYSLLPDAQETCAQTMLRGFVVGGISTVRYSPWIDTTTVIDTIKNIVKPSFIKVYPNPASKSGFVNVQPKSAGSYQLRLLDNDGKLVQQNAFTIYAKKQAYQLELPSSIAAGIYYINVIDDRSKKQYTQKLIIQ